VTNWNASLGTTDVPQISTSQATELTGDFAGYFLVTLTPTGSTLEPQVGLVAKLTATGSGQLAQVSLVWIPGADPTSDDFYWESFGVLTQAVTPGTTAAQITTLETALGKAPGTPPFTAPATATSDSGNVYNQLTKPYTPTTGSPIDVSIISVT
jgi:hypothetical protein